MKTVETGRSRIRATCGESDKGVMVIIGGRNGDGDGDRDGSGKGPSWNARY